MATSFQVVGTYTVGSAPASVATADLSGTGNQDIIVSDQFGSVDVLMSQGDGSFAPAVSLHTGPSASGLAIADLGNGVPDIIVADPNGYVDVLKNLGNGSFGAATSYAAGSLPLAVTTAELPGTGGVQDVIVTDLDGGVDVLRNTGNGTLISPVSYAAGDDPAAITTATLATGVQAVIVADEANGAGVDVLTATGDGGFNPAVSYAAGFAPTAVITADLGNGRQDIIVADLGGGVDVLMQNANDSFAAPVSYATLGQPLSVTTADLTGNGRQDIIVGEDGQGGEDVLMNNGDGSFAPAIHIAAGSNIEAITTVRLTGAANPDIVAVNGDGTVFVIAAQTGPSITVQAPATVEPSQTTILGTVTPDHAGDTLSVSASAGILGTVSLQAGTNGAENVVYTAPANFPESTTDSFTYTVSDTTDNQSSTSGTQTVALDAGPTNSYGTPQVAEQGQTVTIATVTPGEPSDSLTLASSASADGTISLVQDGRSYDVNYTAPASMAASGTDTISYTVADQLGGSVAGNTTVALDSGPVLTEAAPYSLEQGQQTVLGTVTPGLAGDTLTLHQISAALGTVVLGPLRDDGLQAIIYTAPANVPQSVIDTASYSITDQHGGAVTTGNAAVQLDPGPAITAATPATIEGGQPTVIGTVAPGLSGDILTLQQTPETSGTVSLGPVQADGTQQVIYTAPASVPESGTNSVGYRITDQHDDASASASAYVTVDRGPQVTSQPGGTLEQGQQQTIGSVTPGGASDTLTLMQDPGSSGTVSLGPVQDDGTRSILYTAAASVSATGLDSVVYTVTDQLGGTASGSALLTLDSGPALVGTVFGAVEQGQQTVIGMVSRGISGDVLTLTQTAGGLGTVTLGAVQADGSQQVIYTAPAGIDASGSDTVAYSIVDQHGAVAASTTATVSLDAGPTIAPATPALLEQGQTTVLGTVTPGLPGDVLSVSSNAVGSVSLGAVQEDGTRQVIYTAPSNVPFGYTDIVHYQVTDQYNQAVASQVVNVVLDPGPSIIAKSHAPLEQGQHEVIGIVEPGEAADTLTLTQTSGAFGTVSLGPVQDDGSRSVIYTAPASVIRGGADTVSYSITDGNGGIATASASVSLDVGPSITARPPLVVEQAQTTVVGVVKAGAPDDTLTLTQAFGSLGTLTLGAAQEDGTRQVIYTAPPAVLSSRADPIAYSVVDQHGDVRATATGSVTLDAGPTISVANPDAPPAVLEQNQTLVLGTVTPGLSGDTLSVTQTPGALGTVSLGAVQDDGSQQVIYTAPASVAASNLDSVSYAIVDQHDDAVASSNASVMLDAGPAIAATGPVAAEQGQTIVLGTVTPGIAGDTLSLTATPGSLGTVSLGPVLDDGSQQVLYIAPASITASGSDAVSYSIVDQYDDAVASNTVAVTLDVGPSIAQAAPVTVEQGQTMVLGVVTPGIDGDTLSLTQAPGALGTVSLGAMQDDGTRQVLYTAPASITASGGDAVSYSITDQHGDVVASGAPTVTLDAGPSIVAAMPGVIEERQTTVLGTVTPGVAGDTLSLTQALGGLGTVALGAVQADGTQQILYSAPQVVTANGTDTVSYSIVDQHDGIVAGDTASIGLDVGPLIVAATPSVIEERQTTLLGTVSPGRPGDVLSISQDGGALGTVTLGPVQDDGTQQIIYSAPRDVPASTQDTITYKIADQHGSVMASDIAYVKLDSGPAISPQAPAAVEQGQTTVLAVVTPGRTGDTLTLSKTATAPGSIALGAVQADGTQQVIYTAPASVTETGSVAVAYQVVDQHGSVVSVASANVTLAITPFTSLMVAGASASASLTVSLKLEPSVVGSLCNPGGGSISADGGTYTVTGTATQVNAALHALGFASSQAGSATPAFQASLSSNGAAATLYGVPEADQLTAASGNVSLVASGAGAAVVASSGGGDTLVANASGQTLDGSAASTGDVFFGNAAGGTLFKGGLGHDTIVGGGGGNTVSSGTGGSVVFLGSGTNLVQSHGADTIVGGSGSDTIQAGGTGVVLFTGSGATDFVGGDAASTVIGGSGGLTVSGGAGGGAFYGSASGHNLLQSGGGSTFLVAGGDGDQLVATGNASNILVAASGNETLNAAGSAGSDLLYGGSGTDVVSLGSGADTLLAGSGSALVTAGSGSAVFDFVAGSAGSVSITGFDASRDQLALFGYGGNATGDALRSATSSGGNTMLSLSDGTRITLLNVTGLQANAFA